MKNPYAKTQRIDMEVSDSAKTEGYALVELARRMEEVRSGEEPIDTIKIVDIARLNWRIWTIFQTELVREDNEVPAEIRNNLLSLSRFVDKRTVDIIARPEAAKLKVLININREIGAGLLESARRGTSNNNVEHDTASKAQNDNSDDHNPDNQQKDEESSTPASDLDTYL